MFEKVTHNWTVRVLKTLQWVFPLLLVKVDLVYNGNDYVGLIAWTFFVMSLALWLVHFTELNINIVICILELLLAFASVACYGVAVLLSLWDFYASLKYNRMAFPSMIYGSLCMGSVIINSSLFSSYVGVIFLQCVMSSHYGLRRKERREEAFVPKEACSTIVR